MILKVLSRKCAETREVVFSAIDTFSRSALNDEILLGGSNVDWGSCSQQGGGKLMY